MHQILFEIGPLKIYSYGFTLALAFVVATFLARQEAQRSNIPAQAISDLAFVLAVSGILGARLFYVLQNLSSYLERPYEIFMLYKGGLTFYGGFILAIACAVIFFKLKKLLVLPTLDLICPYAALAQALGRIGCFLNGCCYGKPTNSFAGICFPGEDIARYPTQVYSSLNLLLIFVILRVFQAKAGNKLKFSGASFFLYCQLYSVSRFFMEYLRGDNMPILANLSIHQIISAVIFVVATISWIRYAKIPPSS